MAAQQFPGALQTGKNGKKIDVVVAVIGPAGAGKSTFINAALGDDSDESMTVGHGTTACTSEPHSVVVLDPIPGFSNHRLVLLDTPGFNDTHKDDIETWKRITNWLAESRRQKNLVGGILFLHDISAKRFTSSARGSLGMLSRQCGEVALSKVILVTTNWEANAPEQEIREGEMKTKHWNALLDEGVVVHRFLGDKASAERIIKSLLDDIVLPDLRMQTGRVPNRITIPKAEAGKELRFDLKQLFNMQQYETFELEEAWAASGDSEEKAKHDAACIKLDKPQGQVQELRVKRALPQRFLKLLGFRRQ